MCHGPALSELEIDAGGLKTKKLNLRNALLQIDQSPRTPESISKGPLTSDVKT